jgi:hypothetical protein
LAKGDPNGAFADTLTTFRLADSLAEDPVLISLLVRIAQTAIATSTAWQGLASHQWSEAQLMELQDRFARIDFREPLIAAFRGERVLGNTIYESWLGRSSGRGSGREMGSADALASIEGMRPPMLPALAPRGLFRRNQIHQHRLFDALIGQIRDPAWPMTLTSAPTMEAFLRQLELHPITPYTALPAQLAPAFDKAQAKAARVNTTARLAEVACALERYRLKSGRYPERLEELVPGYLKALPLDPLAGQAVRYERTENGWFRLWSVGLNGRDDGGVTIDNDRQGDWVWPVPIPSTDLRLL